MADFGDNVSTNGGFLDELLAGLNEAVISAQRIAEKQHIDMVDLYFDDDTGEPITMDLKIPSTHPEKEFELFEILWGLFIFLWIGWQTLFEKKSILE